MTNDDAQMRRELGELCAPPTSEAGGTSTLVRGSFAVRSFARRQRRAMT